MYKYFIVFSILIGCFILPTKSYAFDYKSYTKELHQIRSLTPANKTVTPVKNNRKQSKSSAIKEITKKLLEALDSDLVPAKLFNAKQTFSVYFKPAKITKLGIRYKF